MEIITDKRKERLRTVASKRQKFTVILENVHDPHNIGAVLRTCDAVGVYEVFILYTDERQKDIKLKDLQSTSTGVRKWVKIHLFKNLDACFNEVRSKYGPIFGTHLNKESVSIYKKDFTSSFSLLFGNEHDGLTEEAILKADGNILIPQFGMAQSLNISVACAVTLYEVLRQRSSKDMYSQDIENLDQFNQDIFDNYVSTHEAAYLNKSKK